MFDVLDFDTGKEVYCMDSCDGYGQQNMGIYTLILPVFFMPFIKNVFMSV